MNMEMESERLERLTWNTISFSQGPATIGNREIDDMALFNVKTRYT